MGIFIYCFTATGKSSLSKKYSNVIDMESTRYKYGESVENEKLKGTKREQVTDWPNNYFEALSEVKDRYDIILISNYICTPWLLKNGYKYWQIYPDVILKEEYRLRMKNRGNNEDFIYYQMLMWDKWLHDCSIDKNCSKHIVLKSGEFVEDGLKREGIMLIK